MNDPCEICLNNVQDEYGSWYCAQGGCLDACPFFESGDEYKIVQKQN